MTLDFLASEALAPFSHGFFTRLGGASSGVFAGLNCGPGSSDQAECVAINRARAAEALGGAPEALVIGVLTADCQPVLFADAKAGVVGAAHAGWKGALDGVLEATLDAMERLGARRSRIRAVIGPTISQRAYEVGPEFFERFLADDPESARFFAGGEGDRMQFDLPGYGLHRLRAAGVAEAEWTRHCTYSDPLRFYSYRRSLHESEADYGRMLSAIKG